MDTHTRTQADTYALLQDVPSHRHFQSVSVLPYFNTCSFPFHTPQMPFDANCELGVRVSWHGNERSCLMSQLSEDRPGTSARESEIQPLWWETQCGPEKEQCYYCPVRPLGVWVLAGVGVKVLEADALHDSSRPLSQAIDCECEAAPKRSFLRPLIVSRYCSVCFFFLSELLKVLFLQPY